MSPATILLVDDDSSVATTLAALLESQGYQVDQTGDIASALAQIEAAPFDGPLTFEGEGGLVTVGREVAAHVRVCDPAQAGWINNRATGIAGRLGITEPQPT